MIKPVLNAMWFHVPYWKGEANADTQALLGSTQGNLLHDKRNVMLFQRITMAAQIVFTIGFGIALAVTPTPFLYIVAIGFAGCAVMGFISNIIGDAWDITTYEKSIRNQQGKEIADMTGRIMEVFFASRILLTGIGAIGGSIAAIPLYAGPALITVGVAGVACTALGAWITYTTGKALYAKCHHISANLPSAV